MKFKESLFRVDKSTLVYKLSQLIYEAAVEVVGKRRVKPEDVVLEHPANPEHGDYATNVAMILFHIGCGFQASSTSDVGLKINTPFDLANAIVNAWRSMGLPDFIAKIEVAKPGFINLWLSQDWLVSQLGKGLEEKEKFGSLSILKSKKILLEHTSPNPQTTIMLGHLRNNFLGMSMANIFEFLGAKIVKDCIVNDRGIHLCRSIWGYLFFGRKRAGLKKEELLEFRKISDLQINLVIKKAAKTPGRWVDALLSGGGIWQSLLDQWVQKKSNWWQPKELNLKPDHANLIWYVLGSRAYNLSKKVKKQVEEILLAWEAEEADVWAIWRRILDWSDKGYQETYERVGSVHDWVWRESDHYKKGKEIVEQGLKKGVFRQSEGAVVTDLVKYNLPDTVAVKADGAAVYLTQDLALTKLKTQKFPSDLYIWDIGTEQKLYLRQLFTICEQLGIAKREKLFHLNYALINFKGGRKMATRRGDVVIADEVLDKLHYRAEKIIKSSNQELRGELNQKELDELAETVAVGAIKYSLLKFSRETTIQFDIDESLALEGNSGPYLQYTFARTQSVLAKMQSDKVTKRQSNFATLKLCNSVTSPEELSLLRTIYKFPEVIQEAGENFAPNLLCNFLFDLAQKYNLFYNRQPILRAETEMLRDLRLALTAAAGQILKNGLNLLGVATPERM